MTEMALYLRRHRGQDRLAAEMGGQVVENQIPHGTACLVGRTRDVRGQDHVFHGQQLFRHRRLAIEDIQRRPGDTARTGASK